VRLSDQLLARFAFAFDNPAWFRILGS